MIRKLNYEGRRVPRLAITIEGPDMTKQSKADRDAADINKIVEKALKTGMMPRTQAQALYADVSSVVDYQQAMEIQLQAQEQFNALPVKTRNRFNNDIGEFLAYAEDPKNKDEILELVTGKKKPRLLVPGEAGYVEGENKTRPDPVEEKT